MGSHRLLTVDVFTARALRGNPVAVVLAADDVPPHDMQRVAAWTNLSETTFVLRPTIAGADYRLRIFTPRGELPFAGHPTVGSAHAVLEAGVVPATATRITQECAAGLVPIRVEPGDGGRRLVLRVPRADVRRTAVDAAAVEEALGARPIVDSPPLVIDVGAVWLVAAYAWEEAVRGLDPDTGRVAELSPVADGGRTIEIGGHAVTVVDGSLAI